MSKRTDPEDLKLLVRFLRSLRDWGQAEMAEAAGVDSSSISHYETGKTVPPRRTVERIAAAVGVPMSLVDACLLPAIAAARATVASPSGEDCDDLTKATAELDQALSGIGRSAVAAFLATLDEDESEPR
jgi:transcriptional regulator with XRE-family HTH domain